MLDWFLRPALQLSSPEWPKRSCWLWFMKYRREWRRGWWGAERWFEGQGGVSNNSCVCLLVVYRVYVYTMTLSSDQTNFPTKKSKLNYPNASIIHTPFYTILTQVSFRANISPVFSPLQCPNNTIGAFHQQWKLSSCCLLSCRESLVFLIIIFLDWNQPHHIHPHHHQDSLRHSQPRTSRTYQFSWSVLFPLFGQE